MQITTMFRIKWTAICCMMGVALLLMPGTELSAAERLRIDTVQMAPFGFFSKDGKSRGFLYDVSNRIAEETGFSYENRIVPFARMLHELETGKADFSIFFRSQKNDQIIVPISPVFSLKNIVIGVKGANFDSLKSLHGKKVARVRGAKYDESFDNDAEIEKVDTRDYSDGVKMVLHKRVDAAILPEIGFLFTLTQLGHSEKDFGEPLVLNTKKLWVQFARATADDKKIAALKAAIEKILKDDTVQNLFRKYTR